MASNTAQPAGIDRLIDLELEGQIIGACMVHPQLVAGIDVTTNDFYSQANRYVWVALVGLAADGEPTHSLPLSARMKDLGTLEAAGGVDYLLNLTDRSEVLKPPLPTQRLRRLAAARRLYSAMVAATAKIQEGDATRELLAVTAATDALEAISKGPQRVVEVPSMAERFEQLAFDGRRLRTGIETLDQVSRGGITPGSFIVLPGAPGAAKTTFSVYLADHWERQGAEVLYIAADESMASVLVRIAQLDGCSRDAIESPMPTARKHLAAKLAQKPRHLHVIDPADDGITLEEASRYLERVAGDRLRVLIVDSLQTVPCAAADTEVTDLGKINAVVAQCKRAARRGTIVIGISEMSRGGYRGQKTDTSALSSAKGTGNIEYGAAMVLALRPVLETPGVIEIEVAKNRLGNEKGVTCRAKIDHERASFREIEPPDVEGEKAAAEARRSAKERARVALTVREHPNVKSRTQLCKLTGMNRNRVFEAIADMLAAGELQMVDGCYRVSIPINPNESGGLA